MPRIINIDKLKQYLSYGAHSYDIKEKKPYKNLAQKLRADCMTIFSLTDVHHLGELCISTLVEIPQIRINTSLVHDFYWSGLNERIKQVDPTEAVSFV